MKVDQETLGDTDESKKAPTTAEAHFLLYASPIVDEAISHLTLLSTSRDAEVLHQLRVALRRLRSLFWAYRPLLDRQFDESQRNLFRHLADAAGKTRDWDIAIALLDETFDYAASLGNRLLTARERALDASRDALSGDGVNGTPELIQFSRHRHCGFDTPSCGVIAAPAAFSR